MNARSLVGQLCTSDAYFRTVEPDGSLCFGHLRALAPEQPTVVPLVLEHDENAVVGQLIYLERHARSGTWLVAVLDPDAPVDWSVPRFLSANGVGREHNRTRPGPDYRFVDVISMRLRHVGLVESPAIVNAPVAVVPVDITQTGSGWPMALGAFPRKVLERAHQAVRAQARDPHRRALAVHEIGSPTKTTTPSMPSTDLPAEVAAECAGRPLHKRVNCGTILAIR